MRAAWSSACQRQSIGSIALRCDVFAARSAFSGCYLYLRVWKFTCYAWALLYEQRPCSCGAHLVLNQVRHTHPCVADGLNLCVCVCVGVCVRARACMRARVFVCVLCLCARMRPYVRACVRAFGRVGKREGAWVHRCVCTCGGGWVPLGGWVECLCMHF